MNEEKILDALSINPLIAPLLFWDGWRTTVAAKQAEARSPQSFKLPRMIEHTENGYFKALCSTFERQLKGDYQNKPLDTSLLRELHRQSTQDVGGLPTKVAMGEFTDRTCRTFQQVLRQEDIESHKRHLQIMTNYAKEIGGHTCNEFMGIGDYSPYPLYGITLYPGCEVLTNDMNIDITEDSRIMYFSCLSREASEKFANKILENYQKELVPCKSDDEKIKCIADMVQQLERLHPFPDANCRTFCMMLLNLELVKNGFSPTLQDNPNDFELLSLDALTTKIKEGMERFQSCIRDNGNLAEVKYKDIKGQPSPISTD